MKRRKTRREKVFLTALGVVLLGMLLFWQPLQREVLTLCVLGVDAPGQAVVAEVVEKYKDHSIPLKRLWHSQKLPHRLAALNYIETASRSDPEILTSLEADLRAAAMDADMEAREIAFTLLARANHPDLPALSLLQLRDADPAARVLGLQYIRQAGDARFLPMIIPYLDDADHSVVSTAGSVIQRWSGEDFGIRVSQALPQFTRSEPVEPTSTNLALLAQGVNRAKEWWKNNQPSDAAPSAPGCTKTASGEVRVPQFAVEDMDGRRVRSSEFRGQAILLAFWDTSTPLSLRYLKALEKTQGQTMDPLLVFGISLDTTVPDRSHEHEHEHHHESGASVKNDIPALHHQLHEVMAREALTLRVLIDTTGETSRLFNITQVPTTVLIDRDGYLRRRFVGLRTSESLAAILREISSTPPNTAL